MTPRKVALTPGCQCRNAPIQVIIAPLRWHAVLQADRLFVSVGKNMSCLFMRSLFAGEQMEREAIRTGANLGVGCDDNTTMQHHDRDSNITTITRQGLACGAGRGAVGVQNPRADFQRQRGVYDAAISARPRHGRR